MLGKEQLSSFIPMDVRTGREIELAMEELWLTGHVLPAGARLMVNHTFKNMQKDHKEVVYSFVLPRDAALRRFLIKGDGFRIESDLKPVKEAEKIYEEGIYDGHLSTMAKRYGDGVVNLNVGNIRPGETISVLIEVIAGVEIHKDGFRLRFPFTLAPCYHSQARVLEVEPGMGEMELPEDLFGDVILPRFAKDSDALHRVGFDLSVWMPQEIKEIGSPSHSLRIVKDDANQVRVLLAPDHDVPDRDLVLDVRQKDEIKGVIGGLDNNGRRRFLAIIPSKRFGKTKKGPKRVVFVLDRSGSMGGLTIIQAKSALNNCLESLSDEDSFGFVAFDNRIEAFKTNLVKGSEANLYDAQEFIKKIEARGGTELSSGLKAGSELLAYGGGDIFLITDGQVFGTETIIQQAKAAGIRIHCLGIGSASQDRFLIQLARGTGGMSRFLTPRENMETVAKELFLSTAGPVASDVKVRAEGIPDARIEPEPSKTVFPDFPLVLFIETEKFAKGSLILEWQADESPGQMEVPLTVTDEKLGETLRLIVGARLISDMEIHILSGNLNPTERRRQKRIESRIEQLSLNYGLASRRTALVAVVQREDDRLGIIPATQVVSVGMTQDTKFSAYFKSQKAILHDFLAPVQFLKESVRPEDIKLSDAKYLYNFNSDFDWEFIIDDKVDKGYYSQPKEKERPPLENILTRPQSLQNYLLWQLRMSIADEQEFWIGEIIISNIDENGYLQENLDGIFNKLSVSRGLTEKVLKLIQELNPLGVGALNTQECLLLQITEKNPKKKALLESIIKNHLHHLESKEYSAISEDLGISTAEVIDLSKIILSLDPKPGYQFNPDESFYFVPDVFVHKVDEKYVMTLNNERLHQVKASNANRRMLRNGHQAPPDQTSKYIAENHRPPLISLNSIRQRQQILYYVSTSIIRFQQEFLGKGVAYLRPLTLMDVAHDISIHESIISQVITNKYICTPRGIFELKFFFNPSFKRG